MRRTREIYTSRSKKLMIAILAVYNGATNVSHELPAFDHWKLSKRKTHERGNVLNIPARVMKIDDRLAESAAKHPETP